jgi:hypothetical protein
VVLESDGGERKTSCLSRLLNSLALALVTMVLLLSRCKQHLLLGIRKAQVREDGSLNRSLGKNALKLPSVLSKFDYAPGAKHQKRKSATA